MNHLGHLWTAYPHNELLIGSMLGDVVKGDASSSFPTMVWQGIKLHRAIDSCVDSHPESLRIRQSVPKNFRRFVGLVLDVHIDHVLAETFDSHSKSDIEEIVAYSVECVRVSPFAPQLQRPLQWILGPGDPSSFSSMKTVRRSVESLNGRLRYRNMPAPNMMDVYDSVIAVDNLHAACTAIIKSCRIVANTFHPSNSHS